MTQVSHISFIASLIVTFIIVLFIFKFIFSSDEIYPHGSGVISTCEVLLIPRISYNSLDNVLLVLALPFKAHFFSAAAVKHARV